MRVRGDVLPSGSFTLEEQPNKPGFCLVRFYENAEPFTETKDGLTVSGYQYDEYRLEMEDTGDLETDVSNNYETLLAQAKALEATCRPCGTRWPRHTVRGCRTHEQPEHDFERDARPGHDRRAGSPGAGR